MDGDEDNTVVGTEFAVDRHAMGEQMGQRLEGFEPLNIMNIDIALEGAEKADALDSSMVRARATSLLTQGDGALHWSSEQPLAAEPTLRLVKSVKEATDELLDRHRSDVHTSCGASIDKQCALGLAIGDALGRELLISEARDVGKAAASLLMAAKKKGRHPEG